MATQAVAQRLLLACISQIDSSKPLDANKPFTLNVEQARDLFYNNSDRDNAYRDLQASCERLYERDVRMKSDDGQNEMRTRFIATAKFDHQLQEATLYFAAGIGRCLGITDLSHSKPNELNNSMILSAIFLRKNVL